MKEETFDYSKVPHNFGLCATDTCPYTDTCLRRIAYTYAPSNNIFLYVLNPKAIERENASIIARIRKCAMPKALSIRQKPSLSASPARSATGSSAYGVSEDIIRSGKGKLCSHQPSSNKSLQLPVT